MEQEHFQNFSCAETSLPTLIVQRKRNSSSSDVVQPHDLNSFPAL